MKVVRAQIGQSKGTLGFSQGLGQNTQAKRFARVRNQGNRKKRHQCQGLEKLGQIALGLTQERQTNQDLRQGKVRVSREKYNQKTFARVSQETRRLEPEFHQGFTKEKPSTRISLGFLQEIKDQPKTTLQNFLSKIKGKITPVWKTNQLRVPQASFHSQTRPNSNVIPVKHYCSTQTKSQTKTKRESKRIRRNEEWMANLQ